MKFEQSPDHFDDFKIDRDSAQEWGERNFKTWERQLTRDEKHKLETFINQNFNLVNLFLEQFQSRLTGLSTREVQEFARKNSLGSEDIEHLIREIFDIEKIIGKSKLEKTTYFYKWVSFPDGIDGTFRIGQKVNPSIVEFLKKISKLGPEIHHEFLTLNLTQNFNSKAKIEENILYQIKAPKGTQAGFIGYFIHDVHKGKQELQEVLFNRGYQFVVKNMSVITHGGKQIIKIEADLVDTMER